MMFQEIFLRPYKCIVARQCQCLNGFVVYQCSGSILGRLINAPVANVNVMSVLQ